jgi:cytochrome c-type biogenesis protein CcmE
MKPKRQRLVFISVALLALAGAAALGLSAVGETMTYFRSPSDIAENRSKPGEAIRLGGLVANGSVHKLNGGVTTGFVVTDNVNSVRVQYTGIVPDLFREGQGVVAEGKLDPNGVFIAKTVLARHDENYMPPEVVEALKASGQWQHAPEAAPKIPQYNPAAQQSVSTPAVGG